MAKRKKKTPPKKISKGQLINMELHAEYLAKQEVIDAPFGKAIRTGAHTSSDGKRYRRHQKHRKSDHRVRHHSFFLPEIY